MTPEQLFSMLNLIDRGRVAAAAVPAAVRWTATVVPW